jgi:hypothetical protein
LHTSTRLSRTNGGARVAVGVEVVVGGRVSEAVWLGCGVLEMVGVPDGPHVMINVAERVKVGVITSVEVLVGVFEGMIVGEELAVRVGESDGSNVFVFWGFVGKAVGT